MGLASSLVSLGDGTLPASFEGLKSQIDIEWIRSALAAHGAATVRKRKLAAEQVVWLIVGMALYRNRPIPEIVRGLDLVLPGPDGERQCVAKGAIPPARDKVGLEPVRELFQTTARQWALASAERHRWRGLMVLGIDGTSLRVPDTRENREAFGLPPSKRRTSAYPQVEVVGLMVLRSHLLLDFAFAGFRETSELALADPMLRNLPPHSLTILDRNYVSYYPLYRIQRDGEERHWLVRGKKNLAWRVVQKLGRRDALVKMRFSFAVRQKHPELPETFVVRLVRYRRKGFRPQYLLTSLLDAEKYPVAEVAELYHERWEIELGYDEIKTHALEREEAIRSKSPERVAQELWGLAVAYNLVRHEMEGVAAELGVPPRQISFRGALMLVRDLFMWAAVASPGNLPKMIQELRLDMRHLVLPPRRSERRYPRHVKIKMTGYARNDGHPA